MVTGPTASGKSSLAVFLAKKFNGEIVSADSRQIYRGLDIGTGKITKKERRGITHYLLDIRNPNKPYTVAEYQKDALRAIEKITLKGKTPILVGGTGLYVAAITENLRIPAVKPNLRLRKKLEKEMASRGISALLEKLFKLDPDAAAFIDPKNPRRVIRALEVILLTGKPFSAQRKKQPPRFEFLKLGVKLSKEKLQGRVNRRVRAMIRAGLENETRHILKTYDLTPLVLQTIGYREMLDFLEGKFDAAETEELIKRNTWRYAKRQMTWYKKDKNIRWIDTRKEAEKVVRKFLNFRSQK